MSHWEDFAGFDPSKLMQNPVQVFDLGKLSGADLSLNNNYWVYINFPLCFSTTGELITAACELGVAHPPGYPLFTMLSSLMLSLLPLSSPAHSINVLCAVFGAGASGALCFTVCRVVGPGPGAVLAGGVFAVSKLVWQWSVVAEVFSLNNLFVGILFSLSACFHCAESFALWGALFCGLSLCNQHTLVLYVVIIIPWALLHLNTLNGLSFFGLVSLGTCFLAGFVPYIYLPISSYLNRARWSWGDQTSLHGLLTHLLRAEYGTFSLVPTDSLVLHCVFVWLIVTMVSIYSVFFAWRANLNIENPLLLGVVERFWLQADAGVCVLAGLGLSWAVCWLNGRLGWGTLWNTGAWVLTAGLISHMISLNHGECDQSSNDVVDRFAREVVSSLPEGSLVLTRGDLPGNTLRYLHYCQGLRPDLSLVDQEMMTYSWYVGKLQKRLPGVTFPGRWWDPVNTVEKKTFSIEQFLKHNMHRPVFVCIGLTEGDPSWERSFSRWPWGVCEQLVPVKTPFDPEKWAHKTLNLYNWSHFHPGSWERVANEEMWQARMKTAFFLFDLAENMEKEQQARLYELSYNLYCHIVDAQVDYPANWDKNLALAAERLLRSGGRGHGLDSLLSRSIRHFSRYLQREPTDPQSKAIRSIITHLRKERDKLRDRQKG
uniref:Transmembrane protein 260 n=1 Tax=Sinocyclocheilus grahami TaxID=75366 RepID=A0A672QU56_SINGR